MKVDRVDRGAGVQKLIADVASEALNGARLDMAKRKASPQGGKQVQVGNSRWRAHGSLHSRYASARVWTADLSGPAGGADGGRAFVGGGTARGDLQEA